jgi:pilus assembly protein Flp/PilA
MSKAFAAVASLRRRLRHDDRGATAVEYGLMVALIAAVIAGVVFTLGHSLHDKFQGVNNCITTASPTDDCAGPAPQSS